MQDTPIDRKSLTTSLLDRYNNAASIANVGGGSEKDVGTSRAATNFVDIPNKYSNQFQVKNPRGFTTVAEQYSTDVLRLSNAKYAPSGRG